MEASVLKFWHDYVNSLLAGLHRQKMPADVFAFRGSREMADQLATLSCPSMKSRSGSPAMREKEIDRWGIGGKLTGVILVGSVSRIECLTNGCRSFANDSRSCRYPPSASQFVLFLEIWI
jgi:hypothetical protein